MPPRQDASYLWGFCNEARIIPWQRLPAQKGGLGAHVTHTLRQKGVSLVSRHLLPVELRRSRCCVTPGTPFPKMWRRPFSPGLKDKESRPWWGHPEFCVLKFRGGNSAHKCPIPAQTFLGAHILLGNAFQVPIVYHLPPVPNLAKDP